MRYLFSLNMIQKSGLAITEISLSFGSVQISTFIASKFGFLGFSI